MPSQTDPESLKQIHSELDLLTMRSLELSQELIDSKLKLEQMTKEGFILMAKARYSNGVNSVSALQFPSDEADFDANVRVTDQECLRGESNVRIKYFSVLDKTVQEEGDKSSVVHRRNVTGNVGSSSKEVPRKKHDPLKWFGILVPQSLKQSAACFERATVLAVEGANIQNEIQGVLARKKYLKRLKAKIEKEAKEST